MRKVIQKQVEELYCDGCQRYLEYGESLEAKFFFAYDSGRDGDNGKFDFCAKCAESVLDFMQKKWKIEVKEDKDGVYE